jgi:hypothetical protein
MDTQTRTVRLLVPFLLCLALAPAAHAVEPAAPKNAAQWCKAWRAGQQTTKLNELFPGNTGYATTFATTNGAGLAKKNLLGRCVSLTAKKLAAAKREQDAAATLKARCKAELAKATPVYTNLGRCISDRGRLLAP